MTMREIVTRINYFRVEKNVSARDLSLSIDKNESYIAQLENRMFNLSVNALMSILDVLGVEPEEFFAKDYRNYKKNIVLNGEYDGLSDEQKEVVLSVVRNFRK